MKRFVDDMNSMMDDLVPSVAAQEEITTLVKEFRETFSTFTDPALWVNLIAEEVYEFIEEVNCQGRSRNSLKEYCDVLYVLEGLLANSTNRTFFEIYESDDYKKIDRRINHCYDELMNVVRIGHQFFTLKEIMTGFRRVHESNMSKLDAHGNVVRREDGKVLKSNLYVKPDMTGIFSNERTLHDLKVYLS
jgi:hypothetical protein